MALKHMQVFITNQNVILFSFVMILVITLYIYILKVTFSQACFISLEH